MIAQCARCHTFKEAGTVCLTCYPHAAIGGDALDQPTQVLNPWVELHTYVWASPEECQTWYQDWILRSLPVSTCGCVEHWQGFVAEHPPSFDSPERFFAWGVIAHNFVNKRLKREEWSLEWAKEVYER